MFIECILSLTLSVDDPNLLQGDSPSNNRTLNKRGKKRHRKRKKRRKRKRRGKKGKKVYSIEPFTKKTLKFPVFKFRHQV